MKTFSLAVWLVGKCGKRCFLNGSFHKLQYTQVIADAWAPSTGTGARQEADGIILPGSHCPVS